MIMHSLSLKELARGEETSNAGTGAGTTAVQTGMDLY